jgi:ABC-type nitrate/sulfonate/bicarbonate transport system permease component
MSKVGDATSLVTSARALSWSARAVWITFVFGVWWLVAQQNLVSSLLVPSPISVVDAAGDIGPNLILHCIVTFARSLTGFVLGAAVGLLIGALVQYSFGIRAIVEPFLDGSRPVPPLALLPFFILIFGFREDGKIVLITLNVAVFMAIATIEGIAKVPEAWVRFSRVSGLSRKHIFLRILLPGSLPWLIGPFRLALAPAFTLSIAAEFMGAQYGLGYLINSARVNLSTATIWLAIILLGAICHLSDQLLNRVLRHATAWYQSSE